MIFGYFLNKDDRFVLPYLLNYDKFSRSPDIHNGVSSHVECVVKLTKAKE